MTGREKPKRKALHRGLDDIVNPDASLTSRLLGRVKPPSREPLEAPAPSADMPADENPRAEKSTPSPARDAAPTVRLRPRPHGEPAPVVRLDEARTEVRQPAPEEIEARKPATAAITAPMTFEEFVARWGFVLRSGGRVGKLRICEVLYENTYGAGRETFFTSYEKLAKLTGLEKKQCAINVKQLEGLGFIERLNIYNTATKQGTEFKLHLEQLPPNARKLPRHHYYDEELLRER